jgi:hypothetical protein
MNKFLMAAALAAATVALPVHAAPAVLGFTGAFAPATWTTTTTGDLPAGDGGSVTFTSSTLTIVGGDNPTADPDFTACTGGSTGNIGPCQITTVHSILDPILFHWIYTTTDIGPGPDIFGILIDGIVQQLSDPGGAPTQSGNVSISPNSSFGFFINCTDCVGGPATATISAFQAGAIPEPGTIALFSLGALAIGVQRQRRYVRTHPRRFV